MTTEVERRKLVQGAQQFTQGTAQAASAHEQYLLELFVQGKLSIEEVCQRLAAEARRNK